MACSFPLHPCKFFQTSPLSIKNTYNLLTTIDKGEEKMKGHFLTLMFGLSALNFTSCNETQISSIEEKVKSQSSNIIIGSDDRKPSLQIFSKEEANKVGLIRAITYLDNNVTRTTVCTGTLIANNYIITAAHCAYDQDQNLLEHLYFYPGIKDEYKFSRRFPVTQVFHPKDYRETNGTVSGVANDFAIFKLGKSADGRSAGKVMGSHAYWGRVEFGDEKVSTIGYPSDKKDSNQFAQAECNAETDPYRENNIILDCDVIKGQSGSPIFKYSKKHGFKYLAGVVVASGSYDNYGARLSKERQNLINKIMKTDSYSSNSEQFKSFNEEWVSHKVNQNSVNLIIQNTCSSQDIHVAYKIKSIVNNEWETDGFFRIKKGQAIPLMASKNGVFYLAALKENGKKLISGDKSFYLDTQGSYIDFKKYETNKWGDYHIKIGCY